MARVVSVGVVGFIVDYLQGRLRVPSVFRSCVCLRVCLLFRRVFLLTRSYCVHLSRLASAYVWLSASVVHPRVFR